jgi:ElaB/YqjD/DUF883 family membrane-anchored ribosome-binding protein
MTTSNGGASVDDLKADLSNLQSDLSSVVETLKKLATQVGEQNVGRAQKATAAAKQQISDASATAEHAIVERPFASVAVAFGIGFLIGKLLDRR